MSHNEVNIKEGAFVLSDAHYSHLRPELLQFIKDIHSKKLQPTQLIFMGDIFDSLFGGVEHTLNANAEIILLLKKISQVIEVIFLEGNHDFNLESIFTDMKVFPISQQPLLCNYKNKKVYLAHGDFDGTFTYRLYTKFARNKGVIYILDIVNSLSNNYILKKLDKYLGEKEDCKEFLGFEDFIKKRVSRKYECDFFIEGHFHQNRNFEVENFNYTNLAAFACNQRYFIVKSSKDKELLEENIFSKGIK